MMVSPTWGSCCHSSSVMKGTKGWSSSSTVRSTAASTNWAVYFCRSSPLYRLCLAISTYQSQNSSQAKSWAARRASPSSYFSRLADTSSATLEARVRIHLSAKLSSGSKAPGLYPSRFIRVKRLAFQILFMKLRALSTRSIWKRMSLPGLLPEMRVKRRESAP